MRFVFLTVAFFSPLRGWVDVLLTGGYVVNIVWLRGLWEVLIIDSWIVKLKYCSRISLSWGCYCCGHGVGGIFIFACKFITSRCCLSASMVVFIDRVWWCLPSWGSICTSQSNFSSKSEALSRVTLRGLFIKLRFVDSVQFCIIGKGKGLPDRKKKQKQNYMRE